MNTQQAYINGFVKRASEYGLSYNEATYLLKQSMQLTGPTGLLTGNPFQRPAPQPAAPASASSAPPFAGQMGGFGGGIGLNASAKPSAEKPAASPVSAPSVLAQPAPSVPETQGSSILSPGAGAPSVSTAPQAPSAPQQQGPSNAFLSKVMGSYNPNSKVDQAQAARIKEMYQPGMTAKQIYADPRYKINREAYGAPKGSNQSGYRGL